MRFAESGVMALCVALLMFGAYLGSPLHAQLQENGHRMTYHEDNITFQSGDVILAGTVVIPEVSGPSSAPGVVLLTGSGPQTRDGELYGFPMFREIAHQFAARGIASLRWDDRGTGGSSGSYRQSTLDAFVRDAREGFAFLRNYPGIDSTAVGFLGHSEGAAVAAHAAVRDSVSSPGTAFLIMLAGPGIACRENLLLQTAAISAADGMSAAATERELRLLARIFDVLERGGAEDDLLEDFRAYASGAIAEMPDAQRRAMGDGSEYARVLLGQRMRMMDTPWFRSVLGCDPASALRALDCPVLALFGGRDLQVVPSINAEGMRAAFRESCHPDADIRILERANHLFLEAETGSPAEYPSLRQEFVRGFGDGIIEWIRKRTHR